MNVNSRSVRPRRNCLSRSIALLSLVIATPAVAGPGDLDPTFGAGGRVILSIPDSGNLNTAQGGTAILQQPDGKLLVGREVYYWSSQEDFSVLRLNVNGSRDTTFGVEGRTSVALAGVNGVVRALLRQSDGKIVAAGEVGGSAAIPLSTSKIGIVRYGADGSVDTSFGNAGIVLNDFDSTRASIAALVQQTDGRLVAGGYVESASGARDMMLARFNADGSLDSTFGTSGKLIVDFAAAGGNDRIRSLALQPDGKLLALGVTGAGRTATVALLRAMPNGTLDATFGQGGTTTVAVRDSRTTNMAIGNTLHLQADGKIVFGAQVITGSPGTMEICNAVIVRLGADGTPDATFGSADGRARIRIGGCERPVENSIGVAPDGTVLVANTTPYVGDAVVARLTAAGQIDTGFGVAGSAIVDLAVEDRWSSADPDFGVRLIRQDDGKIAVLASDRFDWDFGGAYFVVARLLPNGNSRGLISVRQPYYQVEEEAGNVLVAVRRTGGSTGALSVDYAVAADTAIDGVDFASANGTLTWADSDTADKEIEVRLLDDTQVDDWKNVRITLSNATGGASFSSSRALVQIEDNEVAPAPPAPPSPPPTTPPATPPNSDRGGGAGGLPLVFALALGLLCRRRAIRNA